jgi:hypothetical protein
LTIFDLPSLASQSIKVPKCKEWINEAAAELLTKVVPWDQGKLKKFNAQKIPETLDDSA